MSIVKINEFVQEELKKREISEDMSALKEEVYLNIVIKKAQISSLEEAVKALKFAEVQVPEIDSKLTVLKSELESDIKEITEKFEALITEENKDDFIKILKKTKFIHREKIDHKIFNNLRPETINIIREINNEEFMLLSPYKVAELVKSERKLPIIGKFVDLYKPETFGTDIDAWIEKFAKNNEEAQQIRVHFAEISNAAFFTDTMVDDVAIRWSIMIGLSGNMKNDPETKKPLDPEMQEAVKEARELIKKNVVVF